MECFCGIFYLLRIGACLVGYCMSFFLEKSLLIGIICLFAICFVNYFYPVEYHEHPVVRLLSVPEATYHESVKYKVTIDNLSPQSKIVWLKGSTVIDLNDPKYKGSTSNDDNAVLQIDKVTETDEDIYTVKVYNDFGQEKICSSEKLKVVGDPPNVCLGVSYESQPLKCGYTIILEANINSRPSPLRVQWEKDGKELPKDEKKILIDNVNILKATLTIFNANIGDKGEYSISVTNALGTKKKKIRIEIEENRFICISGPVIIGQSGEIKFQTIYPTHVEISQGKWTRKTNSTCTDLASLKEVSIYNPPNKPMVQNVTISNVQEKGEYQLCLSNMESNKINVFIDGSKNISLEKQGNCLRFFELQTVSTKALRKKLDMAPENFQVIWRKFKKCCKGNAKEFLSPKKPKSSKDLDVTRLYAIFRNVIQLKEPKNGWGRKPSSINTNTADDIERIRMHRNELCHNSSFEMITDDFNTAVLDLTGAIRRLSMDNPKLINEISKVLNKVFVDGCEVNKMMDEIKQFQKEAEMSEYNLDKLEAEIKASKIEIKENTLETTQSQDEKKNTSNQSKEIPLKSKQTHEIKNGPGTTAEKQDVIKFLDVYDNSISMLRSCTLAFRTGLLNQGSGICFLKRPLNIEEPIFICKYLSLKIGHTYGC